MAATAEMQPTITRLKRRERLRAWPPVEKMLRAKTEESKGGIAISLFRDPRMRIELFTSLPAKAPPSSPRPSAPPPPAALLRMLRLRSLPRRRNRRPPSQ